MGKIVSRTPKVGRVEMTRAVGIDRTIFQKRNFPASEPLFQACSGAYVMSFTIVTQIPHVAVSTTTRNPLHSFSYIAPLRHKILWAS